MLTDVLELALDLSGVHFVLGDLIIERVLELDPLNARAFRTAGFIALFARDYPLVLTHMNRALELNPNLASAHYAIGCARFMQQDFDGAAGSFAAEPVAIFSQVGAAISEQKRGNALEAQAAFAAMVEQYGDACLYQQSQVFAQWGDLEQSLLRLRQAFAKPDPGVLFAPNDPLLDPLRDEPDFSDLIERLAA